MLRLPHKNPHLNEEEILLLENEIALLEAELVELENEINNFQAQIRTALSAQIRRIQELTDLYKQQKQEKKLKRLAQKKRGKNYREPVGLRLNNKISDVKNPAFSDQQELKRLYKEAIVQIHPDKFTDADDDLNERATAVTVQLNAAYQTGNLEELNRLHEHIISGNALTYVPDQPETANDLQAMIRFLKNKKLKVQELILEIKNSAIYHLFTEHKNIAEFVAEMKMEFENRIVMLEKRTR